MNQVLFAIIVGASMLSGSTATHAEECAEFVANLKSCKPYKCTFTHPLTGEKMTKSIIGFKGGKCFYAEQMPNGGRMDCAYTDKFRKTVAAYYEKVEAAAAAGKSLGASAKWDSSGKTETRHTIDETPIENPLQEALNAGQCKISGYESLPSQGRPGKK